MNRFFLIVAAVFLVIGIAVVVWILPDNARSSASTAPAAAPAQQFDTTGGQEMRPRWNNQEEQDNDAAEN